ncbi:MAG: hypothetical protein IKC71_00435 [Clostridia bacterium]|nr:hypothetical protein [Clostridia bacterium]
MKAYLLEIVVVIFITCVSSLILSEGRLKFFIKSIYSIVLVLVIISPIVKNKGEKVDFNLFSENEIVYDQNFLEYVDNKKIESLKDKIEEILLDFGVKNGQVIIEKDIKTNEIKKIVIDLKNAVIENDNKHINIVKEIKDKLKKETLIEVDVKINEG